MGKFAFRHFLCFVFGCKQCTGVFWYGDATNEFSNYARCKSRQLRGRALDRYHLRYFQKLPNCLRFLLICFLKFQFTCLLLHAYGSFAAYWDGRVDLILSRCRSVLIRLNCSRWVLASSHLHFCTLQDSPQCPRQPLHGHDYWELKIKYCYLKADCLNWHAPARYTLLSYHHCRT